ncbi:MAG: hypothetical protein HQK88_04765 [Nitrospirae bacterium]|nr:hypothetical protein [Nitrospirota bacterium]MBF0533957.1 hypothetical protein [Nitrospirota bacterium]MBF0616116.1 hypothetical protein [Nitrospirota bacterium]
MEYTVEYVPTMPDLRDAVSNENKNRSFRRAKKPLKKIREKEEPVERKSDGHNIDILV